MGKDNGTTKGAASKVLEKHPVPWRAGPPAITTDGPTATIIDARGDVVAQFVPLPGSNPTAVASMLATSFDGGQSARIADDLRDLTLIQSNARSAQELLCSSFELMEAAEKVGAAPDLTIARDINDAAGKAPSPSVQAREMKQQAVHLQMRTEKAMRNVVLKALHLGLSIGAIKELPSGQFEWMPEAQ